MATPKKIVDGKIKLIDGAVADFAGQLEAILADLQTRIVEMAGQLETRNGRIVSSTANLQMAISLRDDIAGYLEQYNAAGKDLLSKYPELLKITDKTLGLAKIDPTFTGIQADVLESLQRVDLSTFAAMGEETMNTFQREFINAVASGRGADELIKSLRTAEVSLGKAKTWGETALQQFERTTRKMQYDRPEVVEIIEKFQYVGPDDDLTRPFCARLLADPRNETGWTRDEIDALDNGQIGNAWISGGGWNCRHDWYPVIG